MLTSQRTIEKNIPLRQSKIWTLNENYYAHKGVDAWKQEVPNFISSNQYIAKHYAEIILRFIHDQITKNPDKKGHTFNIIELSAGSGQFSFYCLNALSKGIKQPHVDGVSFRYIITDLVQKNIDTWRESRHFDPYIHSHQVDFARVDIKKPAPIELLIGGGTLKLDEADQTTLLIANYAIDTIPTDLFYIRNKALYNGEITTRIPTENFDLEEPEDLENIHLEFKPSKTTTSITYKQPIMESIRQDFAHIDNAQYATFPIIALQYIDYIRSQNNDLFLLISDHREIHNANLVKKDRFKFSLHHSLSASVNFDVFDAFFKRIGGDYYYHDDDPAFTTALFFSKNRMADLYHTREYLLPSNKNFSPALVCAILYSFGYGTIPNKKTILSLLTFSENDTTVMAQMSRGIRFYLKKNNRYFKEKIKPMVDDALANVYYPGCENISLYTLGMLLQHLDDPASALSFYEKITKNKDISLRFRVALNRMRCYKRIHKKNPFKKEKRLLIFLAIGHVANVFWLACTRLSKRLGALMRYPIYAALCLAFIYFLIAIL